MNTTSKVVRSLTDWRPEVERVLARRAAKKSPREIYGYLFHLCYWRLQYGWVWSVVIVRLPEIGFDFDGGQSILAGRITGAVRGDAADFLFFYGTYFWWTSLDSDIHLIFINTSIIGWVLRYRTLIHHLLYLPLLRCCAALVVTLRRLMSNISFFIQSRTRYSAWPKRWFG